MTRGTNSPSKITWSRRTLLSAGAGIGAAALAGGLAGCGGGSKGSDIDKLVNNPSDNLNATGMPIVKKPITLHFMTAKAPTTASDYNQVASWKKYQEMSNIDIDWGLIPKEAAEEKRNLALSSGDYPEAFHTCHFGTLDVGKYGSQGAFAKLNTLIDKYMPNLKKLMDEYKDVKNGMTFPDGGIYGMPNIHDPKFLGLRIQFKLWVRGDWLDKFDMDVPTTTDEYYRYLKAVKTKHPNGKDEAVGYSGIGKTDSLRNALAGAFGVMNRGTGAGYLDEDPDTGKLRFYQISDGQRALIEYLHKLYSEGLIAKNIYSVDRAKFNNEVAKGIVGSNVTQAPANYYGGKAKHFVSCPSLKGPDGEHKYNYVHSALGSVGNFIITDKNEHPIETARWMDYFYGDEGSKLFFMGVEGESYKQTKDGVEYLDKIKNNPDGLTLDQALKPYVTYLGGGYPGIVKEAYFKGVESSEESTKAAKKLEPDVQTDVWAGFTFTEEESQKLDGLSDDIEKYVKESRANFITGKTPMSDWNKYVDQVKSMGLDDYMQIQQAALDRYKSE